eukprot:TRINITY_DN19400_c0_g3_i1.p1 TRINITY_DN19400_c0_g3~~TRINITY_DN19400_c0_g3_i1.p1  ORF type:complete len:196 (-),score=52.49 TRINITY_DN19400_c0_g3_i1:64-651(-)
MHCFRQFLVLCLLALLIGASVVGAAKKTKKRKGNEGRSGQRCVICQALAAQAAHTWALAKTTKPGSPYYYIDRGPSGETGEEKVIKKITSAVCNKPFLAKLPNPKAYALHHPTLQYECDDLLEEQAENLIDALAMKEDIAKFCWEQDVCGDDDQKFFDFEPEDDDDVDQEAQAAKKKAQQRFKTPEEMIKEKSEL